MRRPPPKKNSISAGFVKASLMILVSEIGGKRHSLCGRRVLSIRLCESRFEAYVLFDVILNLIWRRNCPSAADKTFFIAAVLAMRNSPTLVLIGSLGALWSMTALSAALGYAAPAVVRAPRPDIGVPSL